ncbi:MAG: hypothetical protein R2720_12210 [Candidatus Nanopelagicales bacterium]
MLPDDPTDKMDPDDPIDKMDPDDPIDKMEPADAKDAALATERALRNDSTDPADIADRTDRLLRHELACLMPRAWHLLAGFAGLVDRTLEIRTASTIWRVADSDYGHS